MSQSRLPPTRRGWLRYAALAAVVLVPLAFAGLFIGAISQVNHSISDIPAAIVNNDVAVNQTDAGGTTTPVLAGRELVTELTGKKSAGFSWTITNSKDAKADLANGTVYAILTVPKTFSKSIVSLGSSSPLKANLIITTDDSHNYLTGSVAQVVGDSLSSEFGQAVTKQYIAGLYSGIGGFGTSLASAATGASQLSTGASGLSSGLSAYVAGAAKVPSGLRQLQTGIESAKNSVQSQAIAPYMSAVSGTASKLSADVAALAADPGNASLLQAVQVDSGTMSAVAAGGSSVANGVGGAFDTLAANTGAFARQTEGLASGGAQLSSGAQSLASGAGSLATGLQTGAAKSPSYTSAQIAKTADVASNPVGVTVDREHEVSSPAQIIATLFVPLGLWIGSLAVFLVLKPLTRRTLSSTAGNARLVLSSIARASVVTGAQALLLVLLLHTAVGVSWSLLPATILFSLVMAIAFTAFHYLLTIGLGRGGLVVSIFLLALQITSTGGLYPIQLLAKPFQFISPLLPLTYGVRGMEAIIANSGVGTAIGAAVALVAFGSASLVIALLAVRRVRRARALGLVPATA
ncbi:MAG TPA: YhgE/Pip family protein [Galbitalea sp.]|nr:YhgE/Pip family protein [Galbitalea sp.]